jgi:F-type H+-transporting ATPase subunit delta
MPAQDDSAAGRYADAIFEIAETEGRLDEWDQDLQVLADVFGSSDIVSWLANPSIAAAEKDALIQTALASGQEGVRNLARLLVSRGRASLAPAILAAYRRDLDEVRGIAHARVTTAVPLSGDDLLAVSSRLTALTGRQVKMETAVDPSIIGGIVVRIGDKLIDGSTRARLQDLKRRLAGAGR